ncbi:MAG TPA: ABC transporter substrate-binding protein [Xanthobacteraceae bacterium]
MKRREFIKLLGGTAVWPLAARAQQPTMPLVGILHSASQAPFERYLTNFRKGLGEAGYIEGQNVSIMQRWADGHYDRLPELAADLVQRRVNVIAVPGNTMSALAAKTASGTIPVVFGIPDDPVKLGLVTSLAHPGGNATGINFFTAELIAKRLGLMHELDPRAVRFAVLVNPGDATVAEATTRDAQAAARALGLQIQIIKASTADEIDGAFEAMIRQRPDALFVAPGGFFNSRRVQLAMLAARAAIPASYSVRDYTEAGGLMSYGTNIGDMFRQVGAYAGRVLRGEKPADLPVLQPTAFEFVINLRTAKVLGLDIPATVLAHADDVID